MTTGIVAKPSGAVKLSLRERMRREIEAENEARRVEQLKELALRRAITFKRLAEILKVDAEEVQDAERDDILSVDGIRFTAIQMFESHGYSLVVLKLCGNCGHDIPVPVRGLLDLAQTLERPEPPFCANCEGVKA